MLVFGQTRFGQTSQPPPDTTGNPPVFGQPSPDTTKPSETSPDKAAEPAAAGQPPAETTSTHTAGSAKRPMRFEDLMLMKRVSDPQLSPDGKWILYSVVDVSLEANTKTSHLWLTPASLTIQLTPIDVTSGKPLTASKAGESRGRFSPDGKHILFTSSRDGASQIYIAPFDSTEGTMGEWTQVTRITTEADGGTWSPDGQSILFVSSVYPECESLPEAALCNQDKDNAEAKNPVKAKIFDALLYRHWTRYTGTKRSHLFLQSISEGAARDLTPDAKNEVPSFSLGGSDEYVFSPDGKEVAYTTNTDPVPAISTNNDVFVLRLDVPNAKAVRISTSPGSDVTPRYSPDGKWIAWRSQARAGFESDRFRLMMYDRETKELKELLPQFDAWVDELVWAPDSKTIYFTSGRTGEVPIYRVNVDASGLLQITDRGDYGDLSMSQDGDSVIATRTTVQQPAEVFAVRPNEPRAGDASAHETRVIQISHRNDALLAELNLPEWETFWFTGAAKAKVQGWITRPPGFDAAKKYPVKMLIHGGPQVPWSDAWSYRWNPELMAANGYVVIQINPHGSPGYGQAFTDEVSGDWGGEPYIDLMRGLDFAEQHFPFIDKNRECALGASYGGYMVNWINGHTDRFKCIVSHDSMFNAESAWGTTEEQWFNDWEFKGSPWQNRALYRKFSPHEYAAKFKTPTLVIHGQLDYRLDVSQGFDLFSTLQRLNIPSKMLYFPDEGHWVLKPKNSQLWNKTVSDWVDQWVGEKAAAAK